MLQRVTIRQRLSEKDAQVQELLKTVSNMTSSMEQMKEQLAQVKQGAAQSLESGPTLAAGIPDAGSAANAPRIPSGWHGIGGNVTPVQPVMSSAETTQFVNVQVPIHDTADVYPASIPMRGYTTESAMMQGTGGQTSTNPQAAA